MPPFVSSNQRAASPCRISACTASNASSASTGFKSPSGSGSGPAAWCRKLLVGAEAKELRVTKPEQTASLFKRHMGTDWTATLAGREFDNSNSVLGFQK